MNKVLHKNDMAILMETGISVGQNTPNLHSKYQVIRENKMKKVDKGQYQHLGAGTAILTRKDLIVQEVTDRLNTDKLVSTIIKVKKEDGNR